MGNDDQGMGLSPEDQDKLAWEIAVRLLTGAGMSDQQARRYFGKLLSQHQMRPRSIYPAMKVAEASGTGDPQGYIGGVFRRRTAADPSLLCSWS